MKINLRIRAGKLYPADDEAKEKLSKFQDAEYLQVDIKNMDIRSIKQNSALHRYFSLVSIELNKRGIRVDPQGMNLEWSMLTVKELIWKEFQKLVLGKDSTRLLNKQELTEIYDYVNNFLGERFSFNVEFPNKEQLENKE